MIVNPYLKVGWSQEAFEFGPILKKTNQRKKKVEDNNFTLFCGKLKKASEIEPPLNEYVLFCSLESWFLHLFLANSQNSTAKNFKEWGCYQSTRKVVFDALVKLKYKYAIELLENGCVDFSSVAEKYF